ncbi:MAG: hypothetical protein IJR00_12950 [Lachnospiraceae bacterium]|nr:hypothetical protein [Lachnospiraceae bacterium]
MKKTLIFYKPEYTDLAIKLRDNYRAHDHEKVDIVSVEEHDDIEYAEKMQYDEAVFIEDRDGVNHGLTDLSKRRYCVLLLWTASAGMNRSREIPVCAFLERGYYCKSW